MPYISKEARERVGVIYRGKGSPQNAGELNYVFTTVMQRYIKEHGLGYQSINDCAGAVLCAQMELYRRIAASYEDKKIAENGDIDILDNA